MLRINRLIDKIYDIVNINVKDRKMTVSYDKISIIKEIYKRATGVQKESGYKNITFKFKCSDSDYSFLKNL